MNNTYNVVHKVHYFTITITITMTITITELCHLYPCPCPSQFAEQNYTTK